MNKFLAIVVAAIIGIAIMFLMGYAFDDTLSEATTIEEVLGIIFGIAAASYFVTGLIAGLLTRQVGPGVTAAIIVLAVNIGYSFSSMNVESNILGIVIAVLFALILGSLGGLVGKVIRGGSGKQEEKGPNNQLAKLEREVAELKSGQEIAKLEREVAELKGGQGTAKQPGIAKQPEIATQSEVKIFEQAVEYAEKELTQGKEKDQIVREFVKQGWSVKSAWDFIAKAEQSIANYRKGS